MKRVTYSKKVDKMLKKGMSLREIRKQLNKGKGKRGQVFTVSNIIIGVIFGSTALIMFLLASPFLKNIISQVTSNISSPVVSFFVTAIPFLILLMLVVFLIAAFRGDAGYE